MNLTFILHFDASSLKDRALAQSQIDGIHAYCKAHGHDLLTRDSSYHNPLWKWQHQTFKLTHDFLWNDDFKTQKTDKVDAVVLITLSTNLADCMTSVLQMLEQDLIVVATQQGDLMALKRSLQGKAWLEDQIAHASVPDPLIDLKGYCDHIGLTAPRTLVEVGAAHPATYRLGQYAGGSSKVILVEANPRLWYCLANGYEDGDFRESWPHHDAPPFAHPGLGHHPNISVVHAAIADKTGETVLFEVNASSYIGGIDSPARVNDGFKENADDARVVPAMTIDEIDDGTIDVLLADCEGSEWFCLKHLKSRPRLIIFELSGQGYVNPYAKEILDWMTREGYDVGGHGETDSWFVRRATT